MDNPPVIPPTPQPEPARKPLIFHPMWLLLIAIGLAVLLAVVQLSGTRAGQQQAKQTLAEKPQAIGQDGVAAFAAREKQQAADLAEKRRQAELDAYAKAAAEQSVDDDAAGIPPATEAQKQSMLGRFANFLKPPSMNIAGGGANGQKPKSEYEKRREAALNSTTVAVDLSHAATEESKREQQPVASNAPTAPIAPTETAPSPTKKASYDFDSASGPEYRIFEGTIIESVLTNRVNGAFVGPIDVMVTTPVYSLNHQQLLITQGTRILGTVSAVTETRQQRLFVAFHRAIMPDGYSLNLDKFTGLNVVGETGLRDKVNHHYMQIFGASLAIGAIGGLAQIGNGFSGLGYDPGVAIRNGISSQMGMESQQVLDRFLNMLPTFTIRERTRVKVYVSQDFEAPAYDQHTMNPDL